LSIFLGKVFDMDFLQKYFNGVFELPLPRNTKKRTKKKVKKKKSRMVGGWVEDLANVRGGPSIFFCRPLGTNGGHVARGTGLWAHIYRFSQFTALASWHQSLPVLAACQWQRGALETGGNDRDGDCSDKL
jgi:hypothetical protein